jgi:hypothetical protein
MRSLDLNRRYYHECVAPILTAHCPEVAERHAAALLGWGSEVLGNDDQYSRAYGWGPRVILFLTEEDHHARHDRVAETLQEYVPPTFLGHPTRFTPPTAGPPQPTTEPDGHLQISITTCKRFVELTFGLKGITCPSPELSARDWLCLTESGLLRLTGGEVYYDGVGELTQLRAYFSYYPDDVWRYRLAYRWTTLAWDIDLIGLCAARGDTLSARLAMAHSVERIVHLVFLLNKTYCPGYLKWLDRQFTKLPDLAADLRQRLQALLGAKDPRTAVQFLYPVLDSLIAYQRRRADLPEVDYRQPPPLDRGFFDYNLQPIIDALRETIKGALRDVPCKIGALDQWVSDQDLLMAPAHLRTLATAYDLEDPWSAITKRPREEWFL